MKNIIILLVLLFALLSCDLQIPEYSDAEMETFEYLLADNVNDLHKNVTENITYVKDEIAWGKKNYLQTPYETASLQTGDNYDKGLLFMFLLKEYLNIDSEAIMFCQNSKLAMAINLLDDDIYNIIENRNYRYSSIIIGETYSVNIPITYPSIDNIVEVIDYDELMYYSEKVHGIPFFLYLDGKEKNIKEN